MTNSPNLTQLPNDQPRLRLLEMRPLKRMRAEVLLRGNPGGSSTGFTLVETLMVVAIAIILLAITTTSIDHVLQTTRGDGALYGVMSQFRQARDVAIARRRSIFSRGAILAWKYSRCTRTRRVAWRPFSW